MARRGWRGVNSFAFHNDGSPLHGVTVPTASPVLGLITSFQEQIEWHLRILSLIVGLAVGVLSLIGLWRKVRGRLRTCLLGFPKLREMDRSASLLNTLSGLAKTASESSQNSRPPLW